MPAKYDVLYWSSWLFYSYCNFHCLATFNYWHIQRSLYTLNFSLFSPLLETFSSLIDFSTRIIVGACKSHRGAFFPNRSPEILQNALGVLLSLQFQEWILQCHLQVFGGSKNRRASLQKYPCFMVRMNFTLFAMYCTHIINCYCRKSIYPLSVSSEGLHKSCESGFFYAEIVNVS